MKLALATVLLASLSAFAPQTAKADVKVLSEREIVIPTKVSPQTVRLSNVGYSNFLVKILVPELADVTFLNHRNPGEEAPCMATWDTSDPEAVIRGMTRVENVAYRIKLSKHTVPVHKTQRCDVFMMEEIDASIGRMRFTHLRQVKVDDRHIDDCR